MRRARWAIAAVLTLVGGIALAPPANRPRRRSADAERHEVYVGTLSPEQVEQLRTLGTGPRGHRAVQHGQRQGRGGAVLTGRQAARLASKGVKLQIKQVRRCGRLAGAARAGRRRLRPCSARTASPAACATSSPPRPPATRSSPSWRPSARTLQGKPIIAVKVTKDARDVPDGRRPAVLYVSAQHAREWITPEMTRRLFHHVLDNYGTRPGDHPAGQHHRAVVPPGGQPGRLRPHLHRGQPAVAQEPARQRRRRPDHRASTASTSTATSPTSGATTTRAPRPTRPATPTAAPGPTPSRRRRRWTGCSAGSASSSSSTTTPPRELLLYGVGWQVSTPTPDDEIYKAMVGDDANPAVPGYDPDISAELYTTNGDTDTHATVRYGTLGFTPEMSTCQTASASVPGRRVAAGGLRQRLHLPGRRGADRRRGRPRTSRSRCRSAKSAARPGQPGLGGRAHHAGLRRRRVRHLVRPQPAGRRRSPGGRCATSGCTTRSTAGAPAPSASASGRAASGTATRTTTTTPNCAAR